MVNNLILGQLHYSPQKRSPLILKLVSDEKTKQTQLLDDVKTQIDLLKERSVNHVINPAYCLFFVHSES